MTTDAALVEQAVSLARRMLADSLADATRSERRRQHRLGRLLADPQGRELLFALTDEVVRIDDPGRAAHRFAAVVRQYPTAALGGLDRLLLRGGAVVAPLLPALVMPLIVRRIRRETHGIVLPAEDPGFARHLRARSAEGVRINVNPLGESILSDAEADERMRQIEQRVDRRDVDYISVKVSAIVANLDALAFEHSVERICDRLRRLHRRAADATPRTFVNLDMEEYRDLELTLQSFMRVLDEPEFRDLDAGIVLQAYLPDSHEALERLGAWAVARRTAGGGTTKVRLVKGANLAMETVEAELHGWIAAPYPSKADVDASYKALLDSALRPEWAGALRIGLASHNLFDVAWALRLADEFDAHERIDFEMLEGMAPAQARQVHAAAGGLLMYAPVVADDDFTACLAYLTRRLDENTQPENFLRSLFTMVPDSPLFEREAQRFRIAVERRRSVSTARRRAPGDPTPWRAFGNEPESDVTDPSVRAAFAAAMERPPRPAVDRITELAAIDAIVERASASFVGAEHSRDARRQWLLDTAEVMRAERAETVALMAHEVGKTVHEGDPEVCEAIDFCRYDATEGSGVLDDAVAAGLRVEGRGVVVVVGPWNFPYAIPTGGIAAAIAAGNSVILKPAPEAVATGAWITEQFWRGGVPRDVLQLVVCDDGPIGTRLVTHAAVDTVVLTGSHQTARAFLEERPDMRLFAETSGKNAMIITPSADLDQAIADLLRSAFGHAGQKCSAASLGIIVGELYDDPTFRARLREAVRSTRVGPATEPATMMGPLIQEPTGALRRAFTTLDPGESWLVEPTRLDADPSGRGWTPGVRLDVTDGSWFHQTECFGPVLGLMRARDLDHAITLQNGTPFGLTGGIHSLDTDEIDHWVARVEVGNAYVNRHITGAIVRRQPFGGWKRSSVGGGAKPGGPWHVAQFARVTDPTLELEAARGSFERAAADLVRAEHDPSGLAAEANVLRYQALRRVAVRHDRSQVAQFRVLAAAAEVLAVELLASTSEDESDSEFTARCVAADVDRVRLLCRVAPDVLQAFHRADIVVDDTPPVGGGALELRHWVREQSVSRTTHRHGRTTSS